MIPITCPSKDMHTHISNVILTQQTYEASVTLKDKDDDV
jgi:hypothetical protein